MATDLPAGNGIFDTIDTGKKRSLAHVFARGEEQNYAMLAAAVGWLWRWETDRISSFESPRNDQAIDVLARNPKLRESCQAAHASRKIMAPGVAAFLHYLFSASDPIIAGWFFDALGSGENLSKTSLKTSAILKLRETLVSDRDKRCKRHAYAIIALTIKAWNCTKNRVLCKKLAWSANESFPEVE
jgi:hypothetical protein